MTRSFFIQPRKPPAESAVKPAHSKTLRDEWPLREELSDVVKRWNLNPEWAC